MNDSLKTNPADLRAVAEEAALKAGALLRQKWDEPRELSKKGFRDFVTDADIASQEIITQEIQRHFPGHGFITEEYAPGLPASGSIQWVIDPVDGTSNYSRQVPTYCISIGAMLANELPAGQTGQTNNAETNILAGVIYDPMRDELFSGAIHSGSTLNGEIIRVSSTLNLENALVGMDWSREPEKRQRMIESIGRFIHQVHTVRATGSAALALAWVAAGRLDLYANLVIGPWDVAAAKVIIQEAGGFVSGLTGRPWILNDTGCIASNGPLHSRFLEVAHLLG
jgi:myo-inositol-1(or 4)-monophosphatase